MVPPRAQGAELSAIRFLPIPPSLRASASLRLRGKIRIDKFKLGHYPRGVSLTWVVESFYSEIFPMGEGR